MFKISCGLLQNIVPYIVLSLWVGTTRIPTQRRSRKWGYFLFITRIFRKNVNLWVIKLFFNLKLLLSQREWSEMCADATDLCGWPSRYWTDERARRSSTCIKWPSLSSLSDRESEREDQLTAPYLHNTRAQTWPNLTQDLESTENSLLLQV